MRFIIDSTDNVICFNSLFIGKEVCVMSFYLCAIVVGFTLGIVLDWF